jgi:hypothetical protein
LSKLRLEGVVIPDELADGDAVLLDEVEIRDESAAFGQGGRTEHAAAHSLLLFYVENTASCCLLRRFFRNLYQSDEPAVYFFLFLILLLVIDVLFLLVVCPNFMRLKFLGFLSASAFFVDVEVSLCESSSPVGQLSWLYKLIPFDLFADSHSLPSALFLPR